MIVTLNKQQAAALCLHMMTMRHSFKKLLKKRYKSEQDDFMTAYDYVKDEAIYAVENRLESYDVHCNVIDLRVLHEFLRVYIDKFAAELKKAKADDPDEQLNILQTILDQCEVQLQSA